MNLTIAIVGFAFLFSLEKESGSNDSVFQGDGALVFPVRSVNIQMVTDSVFITRGGRLGWLVQVSTTLRNFGPDTTVQIGFPFHASSPDQDETDTLPNGEYSVNPEFLAEVDGLEVPVTPKRGIQNPALDSHLYPLVYVFNVAFTKGQTREIFQTYTVGGHASSIGTREFKYILRTGSLWKDSIKSLYISLKLRIADIEFVQSISHSEHSVARKGKDLYFSWRYKDIKPEFDLSFETLPYNLSKATWEEVVQDIKSGSLISYGNYARYLRNLAYASYGYPFKNEYIKALFYEKGPYKASSSFDTTMLSSRDKGLIEFLTRIEKEQSK